MRKIVLAALAVLGFALAIAAPAHAAKPWQDQNQVSDGGGGAQ